MTMTKTIAMQKTNSTEKKMQRSVGSTAAHKATIIIHVGTIRLITANHLIKGSAAKAHCNRCNIQVNILFEFHFT